MEIAGSGKLHFYPEEECTAAVQEVGLSTAPPSFIAYHQKIGSGFYRIANSVQLMVATPNTLRFGDGTARDFFCSLQKDQLWDHVLVDGNREVVSSATQRYVFFAKITGMAHVGWNRSTLDASGEMRIDIWDYSEQQEDIPLRIVPTCKGLLEFVGQYWRDGRILEIMPSLEGSKIWPPRVFVAM